MKRTCCRATPRCAGCPVVLMARRRMLGAPPDVFAEILSGRPVRPLPESVERALEELQRRPARITVPADRV